MLDTHPIPTKALQVRTACTRAPVSSACHGLRFHTISRRARGGRGSNRRGPSCSPRRSWPAATCSARCVHFLRQASSEAYSPALPTQPPRDSRGWGALRLRRGPCSSRSSAPARRTSAGPRGWRRSAAGRARGVHGSRVWRRLRKKDSGAARRLVARCDDDIFSRLYGGAKDVIICGVGA